MNNNVNLLLGDCLDKLKELDDNSVDSIVTDPPYGLSFMGKKWDYDVPSTDIWEECLRVLKPGGHLLSFAGSRTYHRMAVRIEDAGFEIRDQIMWVYGSGFPKSHNIGKAVDALQKTGKSNPKAMREVRMGDTYEPTGQIDYKKGRMFSTDIDNDFNTITIDNEWEGWGTALKPAHEPIVMARKPFKGSVADNVLEWETGGINIDGCRIGDDDKLGRFPANVILDEEAGKILDEQSGISKSTGGRSGNKNGVGANGIYGHFEGEVREGDPGFGDVGGASRFFYCPKTSKKDRNEGLNDFPSKNASSMPGRRLAEDMSEYKIDNDVTGRFVTKKQNIHPTVKPTDLMAYLIRLVTKKGGVVLDPFMGSGSTGKAAVREGMDFVGIEREQEYYDIAEGRIQYEIQNKGNKYTTTKSTSNVKVKEEVVGKFW